MSPSLLERGAELDGLRAQLAAARAASGSVALLEAPAGQGKTALLRVLRARGGRGRAARAGRDGRAAGARLRVRVVRQLFEARAAPRRAGAPRDAARGRGGAGRAGVRRRRRRRRGRDATRRSTGSTGCARTSPPSSRCWSSSTTRTGPTRRACASSTRSRAASRICRCCWRSPRGRPSRAPSRRCSTGSRPRPRRGCCGRRRCRRRASASWSARGSTPTPEFVEACFETTARQPAAADRAAARGAVRRAAPTRPTAVRTTVPGTVARTVTARIRRLSPGALAVARATAVLGDATSVRRVAALSGCRPTAAAAELEVLARADLIDADRGPLRAPDGRARSSRPTSAPSARSLHRRAARLLADDGAHDGVVATHLLAAEPEADPWAAGVLAAAGRRALAEGAPDVALRLLRRAAPADAGILLSLGLAQFRTGADPLATLDEAAATGDPEIAAEATRLAATALVLRSEPRAAAGRRLRQPALEHRAAATLAGELEEQLVEAARLQRRRRRRVPARVVERARRARRRRRSPRRCSCHLAHARALAGAPREEVLPPARRALADPRVFARLGVERFAALWAIEALMAVEAAPEAAEATRAMSDLANRSGSRSSRRRGGVDGGALGAALRAPAARRGPRPARARARRRPADPGDGGREHADGDPARPRRRARRPRGRRRASRAAARPAAIFGLWAIQARLLLAEGRAEEALDALDRQEAADTRPPLAGRHPRGLPHPARPRARGARPRRRGPRARRPSRSRARPARGARGRRGDRPLARAALDLDPLPQLEAAVAAARARAAPARPRHRARRLRRRAAPRRPPRRGPLAAARGARPRPPLRRHRARGPRARGARRRRRAARSGSPSAASTRSPPPSAASPSSPSAACATARSPRPSS